MLYEMMLNSVRGLRVGRSFLHSHFCILFYYYAPAFLALYWSIVSTSQGVAGANFSAGS